MRTTTIEVSVETRDALAKMKIHPRQSYEEVIQALIRISEKARVEPKDVMDPVRVRK